MTIGNMGWSAANRYVMRLIASGTAPEQIRRALKAVLKFQKDHSLGVRRLHDVACRCYPGLFERPY